MRLWFSSVVKNRKRKGTSKRAPTSNTILRLEALEPRYGPSSLIVGAASAAVAAGSSLTTTSQGNSSSQPAGSGNSTGHSSGQEIPTSNTQASSATGNISTGSEPFNAGGLDSDFQDMFENPQSDSQESTDANAHEPTSAPVSTGSSVNESQLPPNAPEPPNSLSLSPLAQSQPLPPA
jgi:hypothetical protein